MRKTNFAIGAAALLAAFALAGCADQSDMQQLNQNEFTLRGMIAQDRQQIDALKAQLARQNDEIDELKHGTTEQGSAGGSGMNDRVASLEAEVKALQAGMAATPGAMPPGAATPPPGAPPESVGGVVPSGGETTAEAPPPAPAADIPPTWPNELDQEINDAKSSDEPGIKIYRQGLDAMKAAKYPLAISKFALLQKNYAKSPLSEPAQYFTANALFESENYDQSILQFNDLVMRFPKGKYACAALLREGQAFVKVNDRIDARLTLQKLSGDCSGTPQAVAANAIMKDLQSD